jgi:hypothetical protein
VMDQDSDLGTVAQRSRSLVEPEGLLYLACLVGQSAALGEHVREVELGGLALGWVREEPCEGVGRSSLGPSGGRFRAPTVRLLPCIDRSGMRAREWVDCRPCL